MLELDLRDHAERFVARLPKKHLGQIFRKIKQLLSNPHPPDSKLLKGKSVRGTDIGEYRIIYRVEGERLCVYLIGKRNDNDIYRRLDRLGG